MFSPIFALLIKLVHVALYACANYICAVKCPFKGYLDLSFVILPSIGVTLMYIPAIAVASPTQWERKVFASLVGEM